MHSRSPRSRSGLVWLSVPVRPASMPLSWDFRLLWERNSNLAGPKQSRLDKSSLSKYSREYVTTFHDGVDVSEPDASVRRGRDVSPTEDDTLVEPFDRQAVSAQPLLPRPFAPIPRGWPENRVAPPGTLWLRGSCGARNE